MDLRNNLKKLLVHPLFTAIAGSVATALFTYNMTIHDAVTYNNISSYIESELVVPGLIDKGILSLETPFEQIKEIAKTMSNQKSNYEFSSEEFTSEKEDLETELKETKTELEELKKQKIAKLSSPELNILGENKDTTLKDFMATIDGHAYYLEGFLNTFLPDKITYSEDVVKYGNASEKVNVILEGLAYDDSGLDIYKGDTSFAMGIENYSSGITTKSYTDGIINIACDGKYSELSFVLGHVNNTGILDQTLFLSYLDADGIFKEIDHIDMKEDMPIQTITIPIYNSKTVQIKAKLNHGAQAGSYGLADIYLIK